MLTAAIHTLAQLALVAPPVVVGYLCGRHIRQRLLDQAERDAWDDGFAEGLHLAVRSHLCDDGPDPIGVQLDAAVERTHPNEEPWWN